MNRQELENTLRKMSFDQDQFDAFVNEFGGDHRTPDTIIRNYIDHPEWEPRLCQLLGFLTEEERRTQASLRAAAAAKWSAIAAAISALIALSTLLFAIGFGKAGKKEGRQITPTDQVSSTISQLGSPSN